MWSVQRTAGSVQAANQRARLWGRSSPSPKDHDAPFWTSPSATNTPIPYTLCTSITNVTLPRPRPAKVHHNYQVDLIRPHVVASSHAHVHDSAIPAGPEWRYGTSTEPDLSAANPADLDINS